MLYGVENVVEIQKQNVFYIGGLPALRGFGGSNPYA
jgi:hypothetical protein